MSAEKVSQGGTTQLPTVRKLLAKSPKAAKAMRLKVGEEVLSTWPVDAVKPVLAESIVEALDGWALAHAQDAIGELVWVDGETVVQTRHVRRKRVGEGEAEPVFTGTAADLVVQAQRHVERMSGVYMRGVETAIGQVVELSRQSMALVERQASRVQILEAENEQLRRAQRRQQVVEVVEQEDEASGLDAVASEQLKQIGQVVAPLIMQALAKGVTGGTA